MDLKKATACKFPMEGYRTTGHGPRVMANQPDSPRILCLFLAIPSAVTPFDVCPVGW